MRHRKPDGGCAARRRRRGALPPCATGIPQTPAGPCPASVGDDARIVPQTLRCRRPQAAGEIARPALRPGTGDNAEEAAPRQARRRADEIIGPCAGVASGRGHAAACRPPVLPPVYLALQGGRSRPPGALRRPGRVLARQGAAPLSRLTPTAPLTGEPSGWRSPQSLPCKGRWMRRKAQTEGCIAALCHRYPANPGRALPRVRRGRCLHRPANPAMPQTPSGGRKRPPCIAAGNGR